MNQTQFKRWSKTVIKTLDKLGIKDYQIYLHFEPIDADLGEGEQLIGYTECNHCNRWANLILNKGFKGKLSNAEIESNAKHEALELFFNKTRRMMEQYYASEYVDSIIHSYIRTLEKII